ncbi:signal peptidase I [Thiolinea disciformis]|uniref:signal peptidase I n=1 Tax=Thiolinea disciformis TaxID=125614 RepID=UPI000379EC8A|nr:signal peptidase I [Thiolinea disciformis]
MDMDMEFWLVVATLITGLISLIYWLMTRGKPKTEGGLEPWYVEYARSFFPVLLVVLLLRSFVFEPFRIPSGSMLPTLEIGDFILVNKFTYGLRLPVTHHKLLALNEPKTGDVVVFRFPKNPKVDYIKRVIGVPGDTIEWRNKELFINGTPALNKSIGEYNAVDQDNRVTVTNRFSESLGSVQHDILQVPIASGPVGKIIVPDGHYFVMGDNRDMSNDSRYWGLVPEENLVGKAILIWFHFNMGGDGLNLSRIQTID